MAFWKSRLYVSVLVLTGCVDLESEVELDTVERELLGFAVAPALQTERVEINHPETGRTIVERPVRSS